MDGSRRKELKEQYKQLRAEMGVFALRCADTNYVYLGASQNIGAAFNSTLFQLKNNAFPGNHRLLADWNRFGPEGVKTETLEVLDYDKDNELKTDYREDLAVLKEFWREKLIAEGFNVENLNPRDR